MPPTKNAPGATARRKRRPPAAQANLYRAVDNGPGLDLDPGQFGGSAEEGWGRAYESFLRLNEGAFSSLGVTAQFDSTDRGPRLALYPGGRAGAIPLRSGTTGHVAGRYVVRPRFGWPGVGGILSLTGWHSGPEILPMPLVPGSGREVPPWVIAGPVTARLAILLDQMKRGFGFCEAVMLSPRGTIQWARYLKDSLATGKWHHVPSRFPDLTADPLLRGAVRWTLERVLQDLTVAGGDDRVALALRANARRLLELLIDVIPVYPRPELVRSAGDSDALLERAVKSGLEAIGWVRDERGLGGGRQMDGLAWSLPLERLWEDYVARLVADQVRHEGGVLRTGRKGETVTPLHWSDASLRTLGHLVPDIVVTRASSVWIVDAKYKAHFADIDEAGWRRMADDIRESHRADVHQVLAYTALFEAQNVTATLAYPLRLDTWKALRERQQDRAVAHLYHGARHVRLELWGMPFGPGRHDHVPPD